MIERLDTVDGAAQGVAAAVLDRRGAAVGRRRGRGPRNAVVRRGDFVLGPVDLQLDLRDRIAVTGPNGAGKSTLLVAAARAHSPRRPASSASAPASWSARSTRRAPRSRATTSSSTRSPARSRDWPTADVRTLLAKFGLGSDHVNRPASSLSPGERTRAALALLQARGVNLLVLDEPTNHLDLPAIEQLEEALESFEGTVLLVTHDRRMLDTVRLTRRWHVEDGQVTEINAD